MRSLEESYYFSWQLVMKNLAAAFLSQQEKVVKFGFDDNI